MDGCGRLAADVPSAAHAPSGSITLDVFTGTVPAAAAERFKYVASGVVLSVKAADVAQLGALHQKQLVLVQKDSAAKVQNATTLQVAGALDDLYGEANGVGDLGVKLGSGVTTFKLWAPSHVVEVFVRGVGLVRNLVTDRYSISLSTDSKRSCIADLSSASLKPACCDASKPPAKVAQRPSSAGSARPSPASPRRPGPSGARSTSGTSLGFKLTACTARPGPPKDTRR
jgi:pullulanase